MCSRNTHISGQGVRSYHQLKLEYVAWWKEGNAKWGKGTLCARAAQSTQDHNGRPTPTSNLALRLIACRLPFVLEHRVVVHSIQDGVPNEVLRSDVHFLIIFNDDCRAVFENARALESTGVCFLFLGGWVVGV